MKAVFENEIVYLTTDGFTFWMAYFMDVNTP